MTSSLGHGVRLLADLARITRATLLEERALRRAAATMPRPVPWTWAEPRVFPLLAGPRLDRPGLEIVRSVADLGCVIVFGLQLGRRFAMVDAAVAERWECSVGQIEAVAMVNLLRSAARVDRREVVSGTLSGRMVRMLERPSWSSSLLLIPSELRRLFGDHDQILATPSTSRLLSVPIDTPPPVVADIVLDLEARERWPLMLDPFVLLGSELTWEGGDSDDDQWRLPRA